MAGVQQIHRHQAPCTTAFPGFLSPQRARRHVIKEIHLELCYSLIQSEALHVVLRYIAGLLGFAEVSKVVASLGFFDFDFALTVAHISFRSGALPGRTNLSERAVHIFCMYGLYFSASSRNCPERQDNGFKVAHSSSLMAFQVGVES